MNRTKYHDLADAQHSGQQPQGSAQSGLIKGTRCGVQKKSWLLFEALEFTENPFSGERKRSRRRNRLSLGHQSGVSLCIRAEARSDSDRWGWEGSGRLRAQPRSLGAILQSCVGVRRGSPCFAGTLRLR